MGWSLDIPATSDLANLTLRSLPSSILSANNSDRSIPDGAAYTPPASCHDAATHLKMPFALAAPATCFVVTPVTTLLIAWAEQIQSINTSLTIPAAVEQARAEIASMLRIEPEYVNCNRDAMSAAVTQGNATALNALRAEQAIMSTLVATCSFVAQGLTHMPACGSIAFEVLASQLRARWASPGNSTVVAGVLADQSTLFALINAVIIAATAPDSGVATPPSEQLSDTIRVAAAAGAILRALQLQSSTQDVESLLIAGMVAQDYLADLLASLGSGQLSATSFNSLTSTAALANVYGSIPNVPGFLVPGWPNRQLGTNPPEPSPSAPVPSPGGSNIIGGGRGLEGKGGSGSSLLLIVMALPLLLILLLVCWLIIVMRKRRR